MAAGDLTVVIDQVQYNVAPELRRDHTAGGALRALPTIIKARISWLARESRRDLLLLCLVNGDGEARFFIYDEAKDSFSAYMEVSTTPKSVIVLEPDESVNGACRIYGRHHEPAGRRPGEGLGCPRAQRIPST